MIDPITNLPSRSQTNEAFNQSADGAWPQLNRYAGQANALATDVTAKHQAVISLEASAQVAATSASASATDAAAAVNSAAQIAGATKWLSGTNYTDGKAVWSPTSKLTYRKNGDGLSNVDPSVDVTGWVPLTPTGGGAGGAIITGDIVLSASSPAAMIVAPTMHGKYAILPDGMTLSKGITQYAFYNQSEIPFGIKNKAAVILGWVPPFSGASLLLADNATAASVWGGVGLQKIAITSEALVFGEVTRRVQLDTDREFFLFMRGSQQYGIIFDASATSTNEYGSLTYIGSDAGNALTIDVVLASADLLLLTWIEAGSNPIKVKAMTISVSGNSIVPNTGGIQTYTGTYSGSYLSRSLTIGNSHFTGWEEGSERRVMGITVAGTTPAFGVPRALTSGGTNAAPLLLNYNGVLAAITNTNVVVECAPFSVQGNALTPGAVAQLPHGTTNYTLRAYANGVGNIFAQYDGGVAIFKITGTAASVSNYSTGTPPTNMNYSAITPISTNKVLVSKLSSSSVYFYLVTDTNGVASGNSNGIQPSPYSLDQITQLVSSGDTANVLVGSSYVRSVIGVQCGTASPGLSNTQIRTYDFSSQVGVSYYAAGQDKFANIAVTQLRSSTRDFFIGSSAYPAHIQISNKELHYGYGRFDYPDIQGKTNSVGWGTRENLQNDMSVLRRIEVCE